MMRKTLLAAILLTAWTASPAAGADKAGEQTNGGYEVEIVRDLAYYDGPDADRVKHKLDLYLPKGAKDFPVLFFVHGGGWRHGDKKIVFDVYGNLARSFAKRGVGVAVTNYRLAPKVQHPAHAQDVARAFAWTYLNIARHGGNPDQLFACGHSAGGHLVALLATDPSYLQAEKLDIKHIKGVIAISGVFTIPDGFLRHAFGSDPKVRLEASPLNHVKGGHPPFLILYADADFPTCDEMSEKMCQALLKCRCEAAVKELKARDHFSIIVQIANDDDPCKVAVLEFLAKHTSKTFK